jgi:hypothetical protein
VERKSRACASVAISPQVRQLRISRLLGAGADIVNGMVYWGSGYSKLGIPGFTGNIKFYAFSLARQ